MKHHAPHAAHPNHGRRSRTVRLSGLAAAAAFLAAPAPAVDVWVDFTSDFHDGSNGAPNGVADWIDELNQAATTGGTTITATERSAIEANVVAELQRVYTGYEVDFVTVQPAGQHDVIYMARDNDHPSVGGGNLGSSPADVGNRNTNGYNPAFLNGNPVGVPKVTTGNFASSLEPAFDTRDELVTELSTALAGTAAHELGHSFGLKHQFVYSHPDITPANYADTGGVQNQYILATGSTGANETERESQRNLSPFSRVIMDIAGGANVSGDNNPLVINPITADASERLGPDAGDTFATAQTLDFTIGTSSQRAISFIEGEMDGGASDVDLFRFVAPVATTLTAHLFSTDLSFGSDEFDPFLELINTLGDVIAFTDDTVWRGDTFQNTGNQADSSLDSFLVNVALDAGTYYLRVTAAAGKTGNVADNGDDYWLVTSLAAVPEPSTALMLLAGGATLLRRRRTNRKVTAG